MKVRTFTNRESEFPNRRKITILEQNANEIIADISFNDIPKAGKEGTKVDSELLTDFQSEIIRAGENSDKAVADSTTALANSNSAISTANSADTKSNQAITTATNADSKSDAAVLTANEASTNATEALNTANSALTNSTTAVSTANSADTKANNAVTTSNTALTNSANAVETANTASETANTALTNSQSAVTTSQEAKTTALKVEAALADRGATINVAEVPQAVVSFTSDPQTQLNNKIDNTFESIKESILSVAYPVGSIYMSINETNPSTLFGGNWEQIQDRFLLAAGSTYSVCSIGGEASHTLTVEEMPTHKHENGISVSASQNTHRHSILSGSGKTANAAGLGYGYCYGIGGADNDTTGRGWRNVTGTGVELVGYETPAITVNSSISNTNTGSSQSHNNMPPYLSVYMWKRIS